MTSEADLMRSIMRECSVGTVRLFRNNVGRFPAGLFNDRAEKVGRWVTYGLGIGSSDLVGINMRTDGIGRFIAIEVKQPGKHATQEQQDFINMVRAMGGQAGVAHSVEEAVEILKQP
jgi:hypothetical protein